MPSKIVCFDLGGVMVRISRNWGEAIDAAGFDPSASPARAEGLLACEPINQFQEGLIDLNTYLEGLRGFLQMDISLNDALRIHNAILMEPYAGTLELVKGLHGLGVRTGCLSNTNRPHCVTMFRTSKFPAIAMLEHKVVSDEVRLSKPDPEIYRYFESTTGFSGSEITFFDDSQANVDAALNLGWQSKRIDPAKATDVQMLAFLDEAGIFPSR